MTISSPTETGQVLHTGPGQMAKVKIPKRSSCQSCAHRGFCDPFGTDHMVVTADNALGARSGQEVQVSFHFEKQSKAISILYIIPLAALILGALAGHALNFTGSRDASAALSSLICVVAAFAVIAWRSRRKVRMDPGQQPRIIRILSSTSSVESSVEGKAE